MYIFLSKGNKEKRIPSYAISGSESQILLLDFYHTIIGTNAFFATTYHHKSAICVIQKHNIGSGPCQKWKNLIGQQIDIGTWKWSPI